MIHTFPHVSQTITLQNKRPSPKQVQRRSGNRMAASPHLRKRHHNRQHLLVEKERRVTGKLQERTNASGVTNASSVMMRNSWKQNAIPENKKSGLKNQKIRQRLRVLRQLPLPKKKKYHQKHLKVNPKALKATKTIPKERGKASRTKHLRQKQKRRRKERKVKVKEKRMGKQARPMLLPP